MGLFDIFTGDSVKDAADANKSLYLANKDEGMGYLDRGFNSSAADLYGGVNAYTPLANLGQEFATGAAGNYLDALGINGPTGNARALANFQASPGYKFQLDQGLQAIDRGAASRGMLGSGNTLMAEQKYGNDLANQTWQQNITNLGSLVYPALSAVSGAAGGQQSGFTNLANLSQNDAQNRTNLATTTTSGLANANMQAAQAEMQGSGNLFNFGLNTAKLISGWGK